MAFASTWKRQKVFLILIQIVFWMAKCWSLHHELERNFPKEVPLWHWFTLIKDIIWQMAAVYIAVGFLFRQFYARKKYLAYWLAVIGAVIGCTALNSIMQLGFMVLQSPVYKVRWMMVAIAYLGHVIDIAMLASVFIVARLVLYYYEKDRLAKQLGQERIETELVFLKSQINPHFLFNALNGIYVLMKEDVAQAEQALLRFSALLRYQLYDCSKGPVLLQNEMTSICNYIDIQKLRTGDQVEIAVLFPDKVPHLHIEPFLLLPFIENAFKYAAPVNSQKPQVRIQILLSGNQLEMITENTFEKEAPELFGNKMPEITDAKGIGLANVIRRLQLLYPEKHSITLIPGKEMFRTDLKIALK